MLIIYKHFIFAVLEHRLIQMQIDCEQIFYIIFAVFIGSLKLHTKFDRNRIIYGWNIEKKLFSKWRWSAIWKLWKLPFWSRDIYLHVILHLWSKFRINRPKKTIFNMASVRQFEFAKFHFFLKFPSSEWKFTAAYATRFDLNRIIHGWDMETKLCSKWRPSSILNFRKIAIFVTWPISTCDSSAPIEISH